MPSITQKASYIALILLTLVVVSGVISIGMSLILGLIYSLSLGNPIREHTQKYSALLLKASIVIIGFGLNINEIIETSLDNFLLTLVTISFALTIGLLLGRLFKIDSKLSFLIAGGSAICGGSAIAALAPTIQAKQSHLLISVSIVFLLNGIGLLIYPELGILLNLNQSEFGLWAALGIHDTSSVVGAVAEYGKESLEIATTTKLARALWIIPLVFVARLAFNGNKADTKFPLFIVFFVLASLIVSFIPMFAPLSEYSPLVAKKGMAVSLFLIGAGFTRETLSEIKFDAMWQAIILWILISIFSLWMIKLF